MMPARRPIPIAVALLVAALLAAQLAGCGGGADRPVAPSGQIVGRSADSPGRIILSAAGAQRIGVRTAAVRRVPAPRPKAKASPSAGIVPVAAVVYDSSGKTYVFTSSRSRQYTEVPITVDHITGGSAYLRAGPRPGTAVVTVGAEELFGVQTGVLAQT
jgi:hypothetical protein